MTTISVDCLNLYEIQDGFFVCDNSGQVMRWLQHNPGMFEAAGGLSFEKSSVSAAITHGNASFSVHFLVREVAGSKANCWLLYVPDYLSKCFNLQCFRHYGPDIDIKALFCDMLGQLKKLIRSAKPPLPVCGYCHPVFTGFAYDTNLFLNDN